MHYLIAIMFEFTHYANAVVMRKTKELGLPGQPAPATGCLPVRGVYRRPPPRRPSRCGPKGSVTGGSPGIR